MGIDIKFSKAKAPAGIISALCKVIFQNVGYSIKVLYLFLKYKCTSLKGDLRLPALGYLYFSFSNLKFGMRKIFSPILQCGF